MTSVVSLELFNKGKGDQKVKIYTFAVAFDLIPDLIICEEEISACTFE